MERINQLCRELFKRVSPKNDWVLVVLYEYPDYLEYKLSSPKQCAKDAQAFLDRLNDERRSVVGVVAMDEFENVYAVVKGAVRFVPRMLVKLQGVYGITKDRIFVCQL